MSALKTTLDGYIRYRGREGQLSFLLHRITGLGTVLFLGIHILDTATVFFIPSLYPHAIEIYSSTPFMIGEIALVFCVIYHGSNGIRLALSDWFPKLWKIRTERTWALFTFILALVLWAPAAGVMFYNLLKYNFHMFGG